MCEEQKERKEKGVVNQSPTSAVEDCFIDETKDKTVEDHDDK